MDDRTYVNLYVPAALAKQALEIIEAYDGGPTEESKTASGELYHFGFEEVNYGSLHCLDDLQAEGIAYDSSWDAGGNYGPGTKSCRFTQEGDADVKEVYDDAIGISPDLLLIHIDDHDKLKEIILAHHQKVGTLPWDDQVENGKLYRLKQLVAPT